MTLIFQPCILFKYVYLLNKLKKEKYDYQMQDSNLQSLAQVESIVDNLAHLTHKKYKQYSSSRLEPFLALIYSPCETVRVFTGSDLITGSDRIGPDRARNWLFSSFLKHFIIIIIMFIKYVYDHNNDVSIIKVGDDSYYLTRSGPKMVK